MEGKLQPIWSSPLVQVPERANARNEKPPLSWRQYARLSCKGTTGTDPATFESRSITKDFDAEDDDEHLYEPAASCA